jgi:hypothetical protein
MVALETLINSHGRNYLLGQKTLASYVHSCTFKVKPESDFITFLLLHCESRKQ